MRSRTSTLSQKNTTVINFARCRARVKFRSVFRAPYRKFKILAILEVLAHVFHAPSRKFKILVNPNVLAHETLREVAPRVEFRLVLRAPSRKFKILAIHVVLAHEFRSVFCAPSRKCKILANPNVLAQESSFDRLPIKNNSSDMLIWLH
ncbi:hypothetical protein BHM03_00048056, partial [Ensete ventricosum]